MTFTIDDSKFRAQLARFVDELGLEAKDVVRDQTRLLLKQVIAFTPPKTLAQGRAAVARDIKRSMTPINLDFFPNARMRDRVEQLAGKNDVTGLRDVFQTSTSWRNWRVEPFSPSLHTGDRDRNGRVRKNRMVFIPETVGGQFAKYVATVQKFVGRLKAAWGPAYLAVGGTLPAWVARHASPRGSVQINFGDPQRPSIEFRNRAVGVGHLRHPFASAMRFRAEGMRRDIARRLKLAAKKSGFK